MFKRGSVDCDHVTQKHVKHWTRGLNKLYNSYHSIKINTNFMLCKEIAAK